MYIILSLYVCILALIVQVELLIRSHDCYTLDCSVDGVAEILKVSRDLTNVLYQGKHFTLMVCVRVLLLSCDCHVNVM